MPPGRCSRHPERQHAALSGARLRAVQTSPPERVRTSPEDFDEDFVSDDVEEIVDPRGFVGEGTGNDRGDGERRDRAAAVVAADAAVDEEHTAARSSAQPDSWDERLRTAV